MQAARQTNYYSFKRPDGVLDDSVESFLARVETDAVPLLRRLASERVQLDWHDRGCVALFIALQELRVPWTRRAFEELYAHLVNQMVRLRADVPGLLERDFEELRESGEGGSSVHAAALREFLKRGEYTVRADPKVSLLTMLQGAPVIHGFLIEMKWTVLCTSVDAPFVTSDNPVVKFDPAYEGGLRGIGLYSPTFRVHFPLTKRAMLVMTHDHAREERWHELVRAGMQAEAKALRETLPVIDYADVQPAEVNTMNRRTLLCTERFAFAPGGNTGIVDLLRGESQAVTIRLG
jgi:hypothetical protein